MTTGTELQDDSVVNDVGPTATIMALTSHSNVVPAMAAPEECSDTTGKELHGKFTIMDANLVEDTTPNSMKRKNSSRQQKKLNKKGNCYSCGIAGQKAPDCRVPKKNKKKNQENMVKANDEVEDFCAMITGCNLVGNPKEWWFDSGATRHICAVKEGFATYTPASPEEKIFMGNTTTA